MRNGSSVACCADIRIRFKAVENDFFQSPFAVCWVAPDDVATLALVCTRCAAARSLESPLAARRLLPAVSPMLLSRQPRRACSEGGYSTQQDSESNPVNFPRATLLKPAVTGTALRHSHCPYKPKAF